MLYTLLCYIYDTDAAKQKIVNKLKGRGCHSLMTGARQKPCIFMSWSGHKRISLKTWKHRTKSRSLFKLYIVMPGFKALLTCLEPSLIGALYQGCQKLFQMGKASLRRDNKPVRDDQKWRGGGVGKQPASQPTHPQKQSSKIETPLIYLTSVVQRSHTIRSYPSSNTWQFIKRFKLFHVMIKWNNHILQ